MIALLSALLMLTATNGGNSSMKAQGTNTLPVTTKREALEVLHSVNQYWQTNHQKHGNAFWHQAA